MKTDAYKSLRTFLILCVIAIVIAAIGDMTNPVVIGLMLPLMFFAALKAISAVWHFLTTHSTQTRMIEATAGLPYRHMHGGTAIAVDPARKEIHLANKRTYKVYPFAALRSWETNIQSGGTAIGTGLAVAAHNVGAAAANARNTGLFLELKDIDRPKWRIAFRNPAAELPRWMEILRQTVNEQA